MNSTILLRMICIAVLVVCATSCISQYNQESVTPDIIYVNGTVITMNSADNVVEAVAVSGNKIIAAGTNDEIRKLAGSETKVKDLTGKVLLPGFYAAHDHFPWAGQLELYQVNLNSPPIGKIEDMNGLINALKEKAKRTPKGNWIIGRGFDDTLLKEKRHPTRLDLDKVSTGHPIWIIHICGHIAVANTMALKMAKITKDTPVPESGVIRKDPNTGEPTGVFEECGYMVSRSIPPLSTEQSMRAIEWCSKHYIAKGVSTTVIAGADERTISDLKMALDKCLLDLRVIVMTRDSASEPARKMLAKVGPNRLSAGAFKMWQDGSIQAYTGYLTNPYYTAFNGDVSYCGYAMRSRETLTEMVKNANRAGYQIAIHGNGDAAIDDILYAYEQAQTDFPRPDARHRIEHCQMVREDQFDKMQKLGITPSFFVGHVYYWGDRHRDIFLGLERAARISPLRSAVDRGIRFTIHDDTPITPLNPLQSVWVSVNRLTTSGKILGPEQRITPQQALRAVTIDAAWQNFEENIKGSIEPGKFADFVVLAENPLTIEPTKIKDIPILETIVAGKTVYKNN